MLKLKYLFSLLLLLILRSSFAQTIDWCPPGATWHYSRLGWVTTGYLECTYINDSIFAGETFNVIQIRQLEWDYSFNPPTDSLKGYIYTFTDSGVVYFWDNGSIEILYDFNAGSGDYWTLPGLTVGKTDTFFVDSTSNVVINNDTLRCLWIHSNAGSDRYFHDYPSRIIEKLGSGGFMLPTPWSGTEVRQFRCYSDSLFGVYESGIADSCTAFVSGTYRNGDMDIIRLDVYPRPADYFVNIDLHDQGSYAGRIISMDGRQVWSARNLDRCTAIDISSWSSGTYLLLITDDNGRFVSEKIVVRR